MKIKLLFFIFFLNIPILHIEQVSGLPDLDGIPEEFEWNQGVSLEIELTNSKFLELTTLYSTTHMYFLAKLEHRGLNDVINLDTSKPHDYFGIEFDNNEDDVIMGSSSNPDDLIMVNYIEEGAVDMYSKNYKVYSDTANGGSNDVEGKGGANDGILYWEMKKPLISTDNQGSDISLEVGDDYYIMVAVWDDKPPYSGQASVNVREGNRQFIRLTVGEGVNLSTENRYITIIFIAGLGIAVLVMKLNKVGIRVSKNDF